MFWRTVGAFLLLGKAIFNEWMNLKQHREDEASLQSQDCRKVLANAKTGVG
jgi:hypothetical protein